MEWLKYPENKPDGDEDVMIWCRLKYHSTYFRIDACYQEEDKRNKTKAYFQVDDYPNGSPTAIIDVRYFCRYPEDPE